MVVHVTKFKVVLYHVVWNYVMKFGVGVRESYDVITSLAKEVMFLVVLVCLSVSNITQNVLNSNELFILTACLSDCLLVCPSPSIQLSVHPMVSPSVCLSVRLCSRPPSCSSCLPVCLSSGLSICPFTSLSDHQADLRSICPTVLSVWSSLRSITYSHW